MRAQQIKSFLYNLLLKLIYILIFCVLIFAVYKIFDWQNIKKRILTGSVQDISEEMNYNLPIASKNREINYEEEKYLNDIIKRLKRQEINISSIDIVGPDALLHKEDSSFYIKISFRNDIEKTWNNFVSIYLDPIFKKDLQDNINNIEYIDLRFTNKVFYKNKNGEQTSKQELLATSTAEMH